MSNHHLDKEWNTNNALKLMLLQMYVLSVFILLSLLIEIISYYNEPNIAQYTEKMFISLRRVRVRFALECSY